ncbi:DUF874 domain-containing protein [Sulfitobacter sp. S190]|uniref:GumC family protein n=1 Tax=Sulfitobacter sp. S190 TaxID=2867022 RepID=UPI0021A680DE|nr:DUF874 domain-containing protein [Sulfitobacter sp. S190]UWR23519.1 DUF874 domain-containing protein [Sulfitobacter sp. S190]
MGPIYTWHDFLDMTRRRLGVISFVVIAGCFASIFWALSYPHIYQASEVIQIEQPKVNDELARSVVDGSSARRLQLIEQQLMARGTLEEIIAQYGIYDHLPAITLGEKVNLLRQSVSITGVAAAREGFTDDGTISVLTITANMDTAPLAAEVAREFANRTRALSAARRLEQTAETLAFFRKQEENVMTEIVALERELETFRSENDLTLEGGVEFRLNEISQLNESLIDIDRAIIAAQLARTQIDRDARPSTVARAEQEIDAQLDTLTQQRTLLVERRETLRQSIQSSPEVQRELAAFERRMDQLQGQMEIIATRRNEAEVGFSLENDAQGERLTTIEEARVPDYPVTMSRKKRAIIGAMGSLTLAFVLAWLLELRRPVIRSARQMERETGVLPVISVPELNMPQSRWAKARARRRAAGQQGREARLARGGS